MRLQLCGLGVCRVWGLGAVGFTLSQLGLRQTRSPEGLGFMTQITKEERRSGFGLGVKTVLGREWAVQANTHDMMGRSQGPNVLTLIDVVVE